MRRETENEVALFPWVTLSSVSHQSSHRGHGCRQWQALVTHCSYALINWCSKTLAMICTKYSPSASVYGNVSFVQRCRAAQGRLLQGRAQSSDLIDPSDSMSTERSAGRSLTVWTCPSLPSLCNYQVNIDHITQKPTGTKQLSSAPCQGKTHTSWTWKE